MKREILEVEILTNGKFCSSKEAQCPHLTNKYGMAQKDYFCNVLNEVLIKDEEGMPLREPACLKLKYFPM